MNPAFVSAFARQVSAVARFAVLLFLLGGSQIVAQENNQAPANFDLLFNGRDLSGWHGRGDVSPKDWAAMTAEQSARRKAQDTENAKQHWSVENGELVNDGAGVYLTTDREFENLELCVDYKTVAKADSGIYLRATPQIQIWDYTEEGGKWSIGADKGSGGLWNNSPGAAGKDPLVLADRPFGQWNRFYIRQIGARTTVELNGQLVVDHAAMENYWDRNRPLVRRGPVQLQTHGGEIRWRNIFVREVPWDEALQSLREKDADGFEPVFDGETFEGWLGPVDEYEIRDAPWSANRGAGGTIYTQQEFGDFAVRLEFQLPPGGNNGLAIRYPGQGDTAYVGMCELQVLDSEHAKYARGSTRASTTAQLTEWWPLRGYLRPTGEWNFQEVTVVGSRIRVELNGYTILDADLAGVDDFMGGSPHPGKDRLRGHFGFAGHSDPVQFRRISIRRLD